MNEIANLKEAKELVEKYRSITLEQITEYWNSMSVAEQFSKAEKKKMLKRLTGFGQATYCSLCKQIYLSNCETCIYEIITDSVCYAGDNSSTYRKIADFTSCTELLQAYRKRADYLQSLIDIAEKEVNNATENI